MDAIIQIQRGVDQLRSAAPNFAAGMGLTQEPASTGNGQSNLASATADGASQQNQFSGFMSRMLESLARLES